MNKDDLVTETMKRITAGGYNSHESSWEHKVCIMLHALQGIVDNGGFEYFFELSFKDNPVMDDFAAVFQAVGAHSSASAVREALRQSQLSEPKYDDLNLVLWNNSESNYDLLEKYIASHTNNYL